MRVVTGVTLASRGVSGFSPDAAMLPALLLVLDASLAVCLVLGVWTPVAGSLVGLLELLHLFVPASVMPMYRGELWSHVLLATLGVALALLGPGGWSIDARLFGWKRIDVRDQPRHQPSPR
jgi:uncharacterized membrane protein YphA (DoxX/SURF4 family)